MTAMATGASTAAPTDGYQRISNSATTEVASPVRSHDMTVRSGCKPGSPCCGAGCLRRHPGLAAIGDPDGDEYNDRCERAHEGDQRHPYGQRQRTLLSHRRFDPQPASSCRGG